MTAPTGKNDFGGVLKETGRAGARIVQGDPTVRDRAVTVQRPSELLLGNWASAASWAV